MHHITATILLVSSLTLPCVLWAKTSTAENTPSPSLFGALGLNTVPSARHDPEGTIRAFAHAADPYLHSGVSIQLTEPINITLRQSAEVSSINSSPERFYPGVDLKFRLLKETQYIPELSIGLQSATGHRRMAGEYVAISKRYKDFDFTGGMAWGRLGSAAHVKNPFNIFGSHFKKDRDITSEDPNMFEDWFTGEDIGFFGGIEYFTPLDGVSIKADWGADRYVAELTTSDYNKAPPWSLGLNYQATEWNNIGVSVIGGKKIMGQLSFQSPLQRWTGGQKTATIPPHFNAHRYIRLSSADVQSDAAKDGIQLAVENETSSGLHASLTLQPSLSSPPQIGRAIRHMANNASTTTEALSITPQVYGLRGSQINIIRRDIEDALTTKQGSAQEIWYNTEFRPSDKNTKINRSLLPELASGNFSSRSFRLYLDQAISMSEEDSALLYRTSIIASKDVQIGKGGIFGNAVRLNLSDNLHRLRDYRPQSLLPVRSNIDDFADERLSIERSYLGWTYTLQPDVYLALSGGYLEEMYGGAGGEILYRPFGRTYAIGAQSYLAFKRDPLQSLNLGFSGDTLLTAHINAYYEIPGTQTTLKGQIGRYLAEDIGGSVEVSQNFNNGVRLGAFVTATDQADFDLFGSTTHLYSGLKLGIPIGSPRFIPDGSQIRVTAAQLGRDTGQSIDKPIDLYELTETLSYRHLADQWSGILD